MSVGVNSEKALLYHRLGYWENMTFGDYLQRNTERWPDRLAAIDSTQQVTWAELSENVDRTAAGFVRLGIHAGDIVAVQVPNCIEFLYIRIALQRVGVQVLTIAPDLREHEIVPVLRRTAARAIVVPVEYRGFNYLEMLERIRDQVPSLAHYVLVDGKHWTKAPSMAEWLRQPVPSALRDQLHRAGIGPNDSDLLMLTSGTTGVPKLYARTTNIFAYRARCMNDRIGLTHEDRLFSLAPITQGVGQLFGLACFLTSGATVVLQDRFHPDAALEVLARTRTTVLAGVPTHALRMMVATTLPELDFSCLKLIVLGGAACPPAKQAELEAVFRCTALNYYGMAEIGIPAIPDVSDPPEIRHFTSGRLLPGMEVKVVDQNGKEVPKGERGEILLRGPGLSLGYIDDDDSNVGLFDSEGWGHSGDLGYLDAYDRLRIVGRKKELIIRGGLNILPQELEDLLAQHPAVQQVAVVGLPDTELGERACAVVVFHPGQTLNLQEVAAFLLARGISTYKLPERLEMVDLLPVTPIGKVDKRFLRQRFATEHSGDEERR